VVVRCSERLVSAHCQSVDVNFLLRDGVDESDLRLQTGLAVVDTSPGCCLGGYGDGLIIFIARAICKNKKQ